MKNVILALIVLLSGCGSGNEPPVGYIDECYGGDWNKNMVGRSPSYSVVLDLEKKEWPKLALLLKEFSVNHGLRYFDTSQESESLSMISVSACSKNGLYLHADKRIWNFDGKESHSPLPLMVDVTIYSREKEWESIPDKLNEILVKEWPDLVNSEHGYKSSLQNSLI
jgi:hypothetical protein